MPDDRAPEIADQVTSGLGELSPEEVAYLAPDTGFPVVELLEPVAFVNLLSSKQTRFCSEGMKFPQVLHELHGIIDTIDAKLERIDLVRVEVKRRLVAWGEGFAGAQIERDYGSLSKCGGVGSCRREH